MEKAEVSTSDPLDVSQAKDMNSSELSTAILSPKCDIDNSSKNPQSPNVQERVEVFNKISDKRKPEVSPEQQLSRKEKKRLKGQEKALKKRAEHDAKQISLS